VTLAENAIVIAEPKQGKVSSIYRAARRTNSLAKMGSLFRHGIRRSDWPIEFSGLTVASRSAQQSRAIHSRTARR